jgi:hypothetical protein
LLESRSHVATLNYDDLLYRSFIGTSVFRGYDFLLDGFVPNFDPDHLNRWRTARQSFYLHLHGSPLYFNCENGELRKSALSELPLIQGYSSTHVVLTHVHHKAAVISASPILREYWRRLEIAMNESSGLVLFGYGGGDVHLNLMISKHFRDKHVEIIERNHDKYETKDGSRQRFRYWSNKLGVEALYAFWKDDILDHTNWRWVPKGD